MPASFEPLSLDAHGLALHARQRNPAGAPAVLFLHGWLDHGHSFDWLAEHLPDAWRLVTLDFRGMGQSAWLPASAHYAFSDYLVDVEAALRGLGLPSVHLVGHSLGGIVATAYAAARPSRVLSLTLIESLGPMAGEPEAALHRLRGFLEDLERPPHRKPYASLEEVATRLRESMSAMPGPAALHMARHGVELGEGGFVFRFDPRHRRRFGFAYDEAQWLALQSAVTCPTQLLLGSEGMRWEAEKTQRRLDALKSLSRPPLTLPGGHHVHLEQPEAVARALVDFLR